MPKIASRQLCERKMLTKMMVTPYANAKRAVATCSLGPKGGRASFPHRSMASFQAM